MSSFDWRGFLKKWSQDALAYAQDLDDLDAEVFDSEWLGYEGASEEQIVAVESRLSVRLPPSYREFLKVSNGWRQTTPFIYRILSIEEVDQFATKHADWMLSFYQRFNCNPSLISANNCCNGTSSGYSISDFEYFTYGKRQDCRKIRLEYLQSCLDISEKGESCIYLLNPKVINHHQEWEAWFLGDWLPGADRYPSFQAMMEAEYINFLEMRDIA